FVRRSVAWPHADGWWTAAVALFVVIALVLRTRPSYFIFETGDMGEYVNRANRVAQGAPLLQSFPHGFTMYLASSNALFGQAQTVAGLPALGVTFVLGAIAVARALTWRWGALVVGAVVALQTVPVWFSLFPVSESLYAVFMIGALYFHVRMR